jgi:Esterase-like activity of phytase
MGRDIVGAPRSWPRASSAARVIAPCLLVATALAGCRKPTIDRQRAAQLFAEVTVQTDNGLSGLAADAGNALWAVAERRHHAYRISLSAALVPTVETFEVRGVPKDTDLEGIAVLDHLPSAQRFAFGTEGQDDGKATVLLAERTGSTISVTSSIDLPEAAVGIALKSNQGAEGICGDGDTLIVAIEGAGVDHGRRWAPVLRLRQGHIRQTYRLWLTSDVGKISGLDCRLASDGSVKLLAIERHFAVTKILSFTLPAEAAAGAEPAQASAPAMIDLTPVVELDLGPVLRSAMNLEGIAWTEDGRVVAVIDNQWRTITGPNLLLVFRPGVVPIPK